MWMGNMWEPVGAHMLRIRACTFARPTNTICKKSHFNFVKATHFQGTDVQSVGRIVEMRGGGKKISLNSL